jgi:plastocyanin
MSHLSGKRGIRTIVFAMVTLVAASHTGGCFGDDSVTAGGVDAGSTPSSTDGGAPADGATGTDAAATDAAAGDSGANDGGAGDSGAKDSGANDSGGADAAASLNGCTTFVDRSAGSRTLTWDTGVSLLPEHCMLIHAGQSVTWSGDFTVHPIVPQGGDVPTPVTAVNSGVVDTVTFPNAGTYGYQCTIHGYMTGAIKVE